MIPALLLVAALSAPAAASEAAAQPPADWTCEGRIAMLRHSEIVEGGSIEGFVEATRAHMAWYRKHGVETNIQVVARVVERDADTGREVPSETEVVTLHVDPPDAEGLPIGDAEWQAFTALYDANARILDAARVCLPDF